ncbi:MAG: hypothetical protein Q7S45_03705 [Candidatus Curtissbacteria bacterium]|nr:hypothetical protein [Candidatus Curtissbacteria bacterium]
MFVLLAQMMRYGNQSGVTTRSNDGTDLHSSMMGWAGSNQNIFWIDSLLSLVTWILVIAVLFALFRWLWKKGDKGR